MVPLWEKGEVTGALKIYYCHAHQITNTLKVMAVGLSQIISTQMEVSRIEHLRQMADKAEMRALQSKINPHFLFNALNAISSSIRLNPDTARQLIINLSRYLRYNLELNDELIDIRKELHQIQDYIAIEQARFGAKLTVIYDIDDDVSVRIPSLLIQPLVENAIVHGIQPCKGKGVVVIAVKDQGDRVKISVKDTGHGINQETIDRVARNEMPGHNIGLLNVHHRVSLLYGEGLHIHRLEPCTEIAFYISKNGGKLHQEASTPPVGGGLMKAIIVEDEFLAQEELSYLIKKHSNIDIVASFEDGLDVLKYLQTHQVDAIFLDINIPSLDGVLLAQNISKFAHRPSIVFITAYKEHAVEAFEIEAFDYILKPYHEARIVTMLQKLEALHQRPPARRNRPAHRAAAATAST